MTWYKLHRANLARGDVAMISKDEIVELLEETGFVMISICGDFDKSKYCEDSPKIVVIARRK